MSQPGAQRVEAAGGVVWRRVGDGVEVVICHRPRYDDWSLPKGKLDPGESHEEAAIREVEEEVGLRCELGPELPSTEYVDHQGRPKRVRWWLMQPVGGEVGGCNEVDEARWVPVSEALEVLSYDRDWQLLAAAVAHLADPAVAPADREEGAR